MIRRFDSHLDFVSTDSQHLWLVVLLQTRVQIPDEAVYILHSANTLGRYIQRFSLQQWENSRADFIYKEKQQKNFDIAASLEENPEFKPVKPCLKFFLWHINHCRLFKC